MRTRMRVVAAAAVGMAIAVAWGGCGGSMGHHETYVEPVREDPAELVEEQRGLEEELSEALARTELDCGAACSVGGRICELSDRICSIASRHRSDAELADRCRDSTDRCHGARERVAARCTCEPR